MQTNVDDTHTLARRLTRGAVVGTGAALLSLLAVACSGGDGNTASNSTSTVAATATRPRKRARAAAHRVCH